MGGTTSSQNTYSDFNQSVTDIVAKTMQKCQTNINAEQIIDVSGSYNILSGNTQSQTIEFNATCAQDQSTLTEIQNKIASAIEQEAKTTGQQLQFGNNESEVSAQVIKNVRQAVTAEAINDIVTTINQKQVITVGGDKNILQNNVQTQSTKMIAEASQKMLSNIKGFTELDSKSKQKASAETKNFLSFLTDWIGELGPLLIIGGVVVGIFFIWYVMPSGRPDPSDDDDSERAPIRRYPALQPSYGFAQPQYMPQPYMSFR